MSSEADLLALPYHYEYKGKVYRISRIITFGMEAAFADWVFSEAINNVERLRAKYAETLGESGLNPEQYENAMNRLYDKLASGNFAWGSQIVVDKANKTWDGVKKLIHFRMLAFDPHVSMELLDESSPTRRRRSDCSRR